jgi:Ca2+-binding RTX toxin-like protein
MVMLSGLLGFMLLGGIVFLPDVEPPIPEKEEFEPDAPELEESAQPTDGPDLLWGRFLDKMIDGRGGDDQIHGYDGNDTLDGADTFVYTDVGDEPIEITDFDPTVDTMAIQFHENDVRDISVHPVSEDVYEIRLSDQVAAHVKSTVPFDTPSILVQTHT